MMTVILKLALLIVGFVVLIYGADFFVDGAVTLIHTESSSLIYSIDEIYREQ